MPQKIVRQGHRFDYLIFLFILAIDILVCDENNTGFSKIMKDNRFFIPYIPNWMQNSFNKVTVAYKSGQQTAASWM